MHAPALRAAGGSGGSGPRAVFSDQHVGDVAKVLVQRAGVNQAGGVAPDRLFEPLVQPIMQHGRRTGIAARVDDRIQSSQGGDSRAARAEQGVQKDIPGELRFAVRAFERSASETSRPTSPRRPLSQVSRRLVPSGPQSPSPASFKTTLGSRSSAGRLAGQPLGGRRAAGDHHRAAAAAGSQFRRGSRQIERRRASADPSFRPVSRHAASWKMP